MFRRPVILLVPYEHFHCPNTYRHNAVNGSRGCSLIGNIKTSCQTFSLTNSRRRSYADLRSGKPPSDLPEYLQWPKLPSVTAVPTPYQIFSLKKDAPYSKQRFYELVMLYHPDRHHCATSTELLPARVKTERYLLIVAANDILSDPVKRSAYDRYGFGWSKHTDVKAPDHHGRHRTSTKWSGFDTNDSPLRNATWEDWEKWYQRNTRRKQQPKHISDGAFLSLIVIVAALAGIGQATARDRSTSILAQYEAVHEDCSKNIRNRKIASYEFENQQDRVQRFLQTRGPYPHETLTSGDENDKKLFGPRDS